MFFHVAVPVTVMYKSYKGEKTPYHLPYRTAPQTERIKYAELTQLVFWDLFVFIDCLSITHCLGMCKSCMQIWEV